MSEPSVLPGSTPTPRGGARRAKRRSGCLPMLLALVVVVAGGWLAWTQVVTPWWDDAFGEPDDFAGPGSGEVLVVVDQGQSVTSIGEELADLGVVASSDAFVDAADGRSIQAGSYLLKEQMRAADAFTLLADPANMAQTMVTVPEGVRAADVVALLAKQTDFRRPAIQRALEDTEALGLPQHANGDPEGYLFPATYAVTPQDTPATVLRAMVERWEQAASDLDLEGAAAELGYTPHEVMTVASLVEAEGRGDDMPRIARVIYNRLENPGTAGQAGFLQIDATVDYALGRPLTVGLTQEERETTDSPYNTFRVKGLPPGPIGNPGEDAIRAALQPAEGDWYYYVTVNLRTGETKFASSYEEFEGYLAELREYCANESRAC
ncbi:endolytic transglycosylase MltG [Nocardioides sp. TF02-7]|uniref:endolytic transglycosylase MltG n=1 Tax=Nocardioides sp. TF02-7 TaxID=2917724 RepID=UPI001F064920|nr:endolytic transglycosylase MltG [Nocardioides sp. TF02-7]UMG92640.1 endolytic transglycosylase MltG [Nocardioides sp. TF02-7]